MISRTQGLLAAVATVALIAGAGGVYAQSDKKMESQGGAQTQMQGKSQNGTQAQSPKAPSGSELQSGSQAPRGQAQDKDMKDEPRGQAQDKDKSPGQAQQRDTQPGAKQQGQAQQKPGEKEGKTVQLNQEQRTKISQTVKQKDVNLRTVERSKVTFQINVGAVVPRTIELYPLPAPIVQIVPAYRGYLYIVVDDQLLIIHPQTYEIVAVIPA